MLNYPPAHGAGLIGSNLPLVSGEQLEEVGGEGRVGRAGQGRVQGKAG